MSHTDREVIDAMLQYGGSFVKAIATAYCLADYDNQRRLRLAFPDYFTQYDEMATRIKAKSTDSER